MYILTGRGLGEARSCVSTNCSAVSVDPFQKQPAELRKVLARSSKNPATWFKGLDSERRFALTSIFNRMCRYGLWCHVDRVLKIVPGEAPLRAAGHKVVVPGSTPSVYFLTSSGKALLKTLMDTGRFCVARGLGASLHKGQTTLREISASDSLHISIGPGNQLDAHIDRYSPAPEQTGSLFCSNRASPESIRHISREVVPEMVRKYLRIPGFQFFPDFELTPTVPQIGPANRQDTVPPPIPGVTLRF